MIFGFLFKKPETTEQRVIRWADTIVENSNYDGELNNECLDPFAEFWRDSPSALPTALIQIRNEIVALQPNNNDGTTVNLDITKKYIQDNYDIVRNHLLNNGYIDKPNHTQKWILNEKGKLMKELGGHKKYVRHRRREINLIEHQNFINWSLIIATALAAIMPWIIELTKPNKPNPTIIRVDSVWLNQQVDELLQKKLSNMQHKLTSQDTTHCR